ncbi:GNAT family N-acetyltransferase [Myxococcota bacterium]
MKLPPIKLILARTAGLFGVYYYNLWYGEKDLRAGVEAVASPIDLEVRRAKAEDLDYIIGRLGSDIKKNFEHAKSIGSFSYVGVHEGKIAGYSWANREVVDLVGACVARLPREGSYNYNSLVFKEFRGKKVFQSLMAAVYREMRAEGCTFTANLVAKLNAPSVAARKRFGVKFQGVRFVKLPLLDPVPIGRRIAVGAAVSDQPPTRP